MKKTARVLFAVVLMGATGGLYAQGNLGSYYQDPVGGWGYAFTGGAAAFGTGGFTALDGTWSHDNGSDGWDGSGLGGTFAAPNNYPGGIGALSEGGLDFIRLQDCGDVRDHGFAESSGNSNRKIYLAHDLAGNGFSSLSQPFLDSGVTLFFRARLPVAGLDPQYPDTAGNGENRTTAGGTPWPATGNGYIGGDGGKGTFTVRQASTDAQISFSLGLATDQTSALAAFGTTGLNMNSLNGTAPSGTVDPFESEGTPNVLPMCSLTDDFHEFWVTIQTDPTGMGTHQVQIYADGSLVPQTFTVTAGNGEDGSNSAYDFIALGAGNTPQMGAVDIDCFAIKDGLHVPAIREAQALVGISSGPANATGGEGGLAAFTVVATGGPPRFIQWQRGDGAGGWTNVPGCGSGYPTLVVGPLLGTDNGAQFRCVVSNSLNAVISPAATLTVDTDKVAPAVVRSFGKYDFTTATVVFSEPVTPATANASGNYTANNGLAIQSAALGADGKTVKLTTSAQTPGTVYTITINEIRDTSFNQNKIAANTQTSFTAWVLNRGFLTRERYLGIPGNATTDLTANPKYPTQADDVGAVNSGQIVQSDPNLDNYGGRLTGWIIPPVSGDYTFWMRGDDDTEFRLSSNADPANLAQIVYAPGAGNPYVQSAPQTLVAGQRYAIEALWKDGVGGDYMQAAWSLPGSADIAIIPATAIEGYVDPTGASVTITADPQSQTALQNRVVTFDVAASFAPAAGPVNYFWQRSGGGGPFVTVAEGTPSYTTPLLNYPADNGSQYRAVVSVPGASATSAVASVTVLQDTVAPAVLSARRPAACADALVILSFDEALNAASATDSAAYEVVNLSYGISYGAGGASVVGSPVLAADGRTVTLTASAPLTNGALYKVAVKNVRDLALNSSGTVNALVNLGGSLIPSGPQNLVVAEAEDYDVNTPRTFDAGAGPVEYYWLFGDTRTGFSGSGVMQCLPNLEGNRPGGAEGCSLDFCVNFPAAGTYYVWVRGGANDGAANSVHIGLDGAVPATGVNLQANFETAGYAWCGWINGGTTDRATIDVPGPGYHTVHIFMREDGFFADKLVVTSDAAFTPSGFGPAESAREQANVPAIQIIPGTLSHEGATFRFNLQTVKGVSNIVEYKNALTDSGWTFLSSSMGTGAIVPITDPGPLPPNRFYRGRLEIP